MVIGHHKRLLVTWQLRWQLLVRGVVLDKVAMMVFIALHGVRVVLQFEGVHAVRGRIHDVFASSEVIPTTVPVAVPHHTVIHAWK